LVLGSCCPPDCAVPSGPATPRRAFPSGESEQGGVACQDRRTASASAIARSSVIATRDKAWADWLHRSLESYRVPSRLVGKQTEAGVIPRRLNPVFRDREELASAAELGRKVNEALGQSENLIVICSPAAAASRWVNEEVLAYKRMGRGGRIFCVIVEGEPNASDLPGREAEECFCPALRCQLDDQGQPGTKRAEPVAADARPGKDGKANARLKLIAGMLDVGFDALKQREQHRKLRRMAAITGLALLVMAVTIVLAVVALISRHNAVLAQHTAVVAQQSAERRQKQAEGLVGFMLGDLNDKLDQVHRLDIMQAVDDKALAYFKSLPVADASDAALDMRVTALEKIGSVRMDQGKTPAALQAYAAASTLAAELLRRAPRNPKSQAAYADSLKWIGQAHWYEGDLKQALKNFQNAAGLLQRAVAKEPNENNFAFSLAAVQNDMGHVLEARGQLAAAQVQYEAVLRIFKKLSIRQPGEKQWKSRVGYAWDNLGKVALEQGHIAQSIKDYRTDQHIKHTLAERDPGDHHAQEALLVSNAILGRTLDLCGDIESATQYTAKAVTSAKALIAFDPSDVDWQEYLGFYSQQLGGLLRQQGKLDRAATADADAVRVLGELAAKHRATSDYHAELAQSQMESARLDLARHQADAAQSLAWAALDALTKLQAKSPDDRSLLLLAAQAKLVLGDIAMQRRDTATAQHDWAQARDALAPEARSGNDPHFLAAWASALLRLDDNAAARPVIARLAAMGYRAPDFVALVTSRKLDYPLIPPSSTKLPRP
jgi:tetratricopeptide (TPR) repeat protein